MEMGKKPGKESDLSCTFCGPGTWGIWEVTTEDGVFVVCEEHHIEMIKAKIIKGKLKFRKEI